MEKFEEDKLGKHKIIKQKNGIKIKILREPSEYYLEKKRARKKKEMEIRKEKNEKNEREKLIKDKMRELAIKELEKEGKI